MSQRSRLGRELVWTGALLAVALVVAGPGLRAAFYFNDVEIQNLPERAHFAAGLRQGMLRWWSPELGAGYPLFAEGQAGAAYPGNLLFALLPAAWQAYGASVLLHLFWAGLGTGLCLRQLGVGRVAAYAGGVAFMCSGPLWFRAIHLNFLHGLSWLPWLTLGLERGVQGRRGGFVLAGVALGLQLLSGHSHPPLLASLWGPAYLVARAAMVSGAGPSALVAVLGSYAGLGLLGLVMLKLPGAWPLALPGLASGIWFLNHLRAAPRCRLLVESMARGLMAAVLGVGLAAVQLLPLLELVPHTARQGGLSVAAALEMSLHWEHLSGLLLPWPHGTGYGDDVGFKLQWGTAVHWEWAPHVGVLTAVTLLLAPLLGRRRERWLFVALAGGALLLAMGQEFVFYRWLLYLPGWESVRGPARLLALFALAAALASGLCLDEVTRHGLPPRPRLAVHGLALALAVFTVSAAALAVPLAERLGPAHARWFTACWSRAAVLATATAALWLVRRRQTWAPQWGLAAALLLTMDLVSGSAGYHRLVHPSYYAPDATVRAARGQRVLAGSYQPTALQANRHLLYRRVSNVEIYTPLSLRRWRQIRDLIGDEVRPENLVARRWLALLRVTQAQRALTGGAGPGLAPLALRPFPPAWVTPRWERATSPAAALALVANDAWRPEAYSIVEAPTTEAPRRGDLGELLWSEFGRHRITCRVTGDSPRVVVIGQCWYPGWQVHVNGAWSAAEPVDYLLLGKLLSPGIQRVDFVYRPLSIRLGLWLTLLSVAALAGWVAARPRCP